MNMKFYCFDFFFDCKIFFAHKNTPHSVVSKFLLFRVSTLWEAYQILQAAFYYIHNSKIKALLRTLHLRMEDVLDLY